MHDLSEWMKQEDLRDSQRKEMEYDEWDTVFDESLLMQDQKTVDEMIDRMTHSFFDESLLMQDQKTIQEMRARMDRVLRDFDSPRKILSSVILAPISIYKLHLSN